jgi:hypothetical protein
LKKIIHKNINRRKFLQRLALTTLAPIALQSFLKNNQALAADPVLSETDPTAKAIQYVKDAKKAKLPKDKASQSCKSCQFFTHESGEGEKELGKCVLTTGKLVYGQGWCMSWVKKA